MVAPMTMSPVARASPGPRPFGRSASQASRHPLGAAERSLDRGPVPHHRGRHCRQTRKELGPGRRRVQHGWHGLLEYFSAGWDRVCTRAHRCHFTIARPRFSHARSIDDAGVDRASSKPTHALLLTGRHPPGGGVVQVVRIVYDGVGMWYSSAATRARDVTPLRLARVPKMEHAGAGPASLSRGLDQGAARGEFGPRGPPRPHCGDWPSRTDSGLLAAIMSPAAVMGPV